MLTENTSSGLQLCNGRRMIMTGMSECFYLGLELPTDINRKKQRYIHPIICLEHTEEKSYSSIFLLPRN